MMFLIVSRRIPVSISPEDYVSMEIERVLEDLSGHGATVRPVRFLDEHMKVAPSYICNDADHTDGSVEVLTIPDDIVHPMAPWLADEGKLPRVLQARQWRLYEEYGIDPSKHFFVIMGSWRYGLNEHDSDYDLGMVVKDADEKAVFLRQSRHQVAGGAAVVIFTLNELFGELKAGNRRAWEIATSTCHDAFCSKGPRSIEDVLPVMVREVISHDSWPDDYVSGSCKYVAEFAPRLKGSPCHEPKPWLRRWKAAKGWAYKLGYYIALDAVVCQDVVRRGMFNPAGAADEIYHDLMRYKHGEVSFEEWLDHMRHTMHPRTLEVLERSI